jgi:hypothetical protein
VDLDRLLIDVVDRVDLDRLVAHVLRGLDLDRVATELLGRLAMDPLLDQLDLTELVLDHVDLGAVVAAALERIDLTQIVLQRVDLIDVAEYVVEGIDLPEIIRESTGSVASEAVRGLRMQGVDADLAIAQVVDRVLHRRRGRQREVGSEPGRG